MVYKLGRRKQDITQEKKQHITKTKRNTTERKRTAYNSDRKKTSEVYKLKRVLKKKNNSKNSQEKKNH